MWRNFTNSSVAGGILIPVAPVMHLCPQHKLIHGWRLTNMELSKSTQPRHHRQKTGPDSSRGLLLENPWFSSKPVQSPAVIHLMMSLPKRKWNNLFLYEILGTLKPGGWLRNTEITCCKESNIRNVMAAPSFSFWLILRKFCCPRKLLSCRGQPQASPAHQLAFQVIRADSLWRLWLPTLVDILPLKITALFPDSYHWCVFSSSKDMRKMTISEDMPEEGKAPIR